MAGETKFRHIGEGACGSVWVDEKEPMTDAYKRHKSRSRRSVANDSHVHQKLEQSLATPQREHPGRFVQISIPRHGRLLSGGDAAEWWKIHSSQFPAEEDQNSCDILISERIPPFDRATRERIISLYCPQNLKTTIYSNPRDEDCLIRPYLVRRTRVSTRPSRFEKPFTLRNKNLTIDQLRELGLPVEEYSHIMAEALAMMLWHAKTDAEDVEFVLAPAGVNSQSQPFDNHNLGPHVLWLFDFDCVKEITLDKTGVDQAAAAFFRNDPYYPRPGREAQEDQELWRLFSKQFIEASQLVLGPESELP